MGDGGADASPSKTAGALLASTLAGGPAAFVRADVALDSEPVIGSFTVDGMTFAVAGGDAVELVGVAADLQRSADSQEGEGSPVAPMLASGSDGIGVDDSTLVVPESVTYESIEYTVSSIAPYAFYLSGVVHVIVPATVSDVDERAFRSSDVAWVDVDPANKAYASSDGVLYSADLSRLLLIPGGRGGAVRVPDTATSVPASAFSHCAGVGSIAVDEGSPAFSSWEGLLYDADGATLLRVPAGATDITIRDGCTAIAAGALEGCAQLSTITASASVASVSPYFFEREPETVMAPVAVAAVEDEAEDGSSEEGASADATQLTAMVALSAADDDLPHVDPAAIAVSLPAGADPAPWRAVGFEVPGEEAQDHAVEEDSLPVASVQEADAARAGLSNMAFDLQGGTTSYIKYQCYVDEGPGPELERKSGITAMADIAYKDICGFSASSTAIIGTTGTLVIQLTTSGWSGNILHLNPPTKPGYTFAGWKRDGGSLTLVSANDYHLSGDVTLTAQWTKNAVSTVNLYQNAGNTTTKYKTVYLWYGKGWYSTASPTDSSTALTTIGTPSWSGRTYKGFSTSSTATTGSYWTSVTTFPSNTSSTFGSATTVKTTSLYAVWSKNAVSTVNLYQTAGNTTTKYKTIYLWYGKGWYSTSSPTDSSTALTTIGTPTRTGYAYKGFSTSSTATTGSYWTSVTTFPSNTSSTFGSATTAKTTNLYAVWTPEVYTITLNNQSATSAGTAYIYEKYATGWYSSSAATSSITTITKPQRTGYTFGGYYTGTNGSGTQRIDATGKITASNTAYSAAGTLYAKWTPGVYTITLNSQSATSAGTAYIYEKYETGWYSSSAATSSITTITKPQRTGYTFGGYYTGTNGSGTQRIDATGKITASNTAYSAAGTLYAFWTAPYSATIDPNGGTIRVFKAFNFNAENLIETGKPATTIQWDGAQRIYGAAANACAHVNIGQNQRNYQAVRVGYTFNGWGGTHPVSVTENVEMKPGVTYVAQWKANAYKVSFDPNQGSGGQGSQVDATYDSDMPAISAVAPVRDGYTFLGWYDNPDYTKGKQYYTAAGASARKYDKASACTLYAGWSKWPSMSLDANGGTFRVTVDLADSDADGSHYVGEVIAEGQTSLSIDFSPSAAMYPHVAHYWRNGYLCAVKAYKSGYTLQGWTGSQPVNSSTGTVGVRDGDYYQAVWSANPYTIAFDTQCDSQIDPVQATYDADVTLPEAPVRKGSIFQGWDTEPDGTGTRYAPGLHAKPNLAQSGTVTLYAQWSPAISADVPQTVEATVDLLGIEEQVPASGYIESRSAAALKVAEVAFGAQPGATELFGADAGQVLLQALPGEGASWATDAPVFSFALDASGEMAIERDPVALAPFAMASYEQRIPISYRFAIPVELLEAIDPARFEQVTTPVCSVVYTVALANQEGGEEGA